MSLQCRRISMVKAAKEKLAEHKNLGQRSPLSIMQVAELIDIVSGLTRPAITTALYNEDSFSLN